MSTFWKTGFSVDQSAKFDDLLESPNVSLELLLKEDDIIQEVKGQNKSLIAFLATRDTLLKMINYSLGNFPEETEDQNQIRFPYICTEIFCCDNDDFYDGIMSDPSLLESIFSFLDLEAPLPQPSVNYFARIVHILLLKRREDMYEYLQDKDNIISQLVNHIGSFPIFEVLMFIIRTEAEIELNNPEEVITWLTTVNFVRMFVEKLTPSNSLEARENATSALSDIVNDVIPSFFAIEEESPETDYDPNEPAIPKIRPYALFPFVFGPECNQPLTILRHICEKSLSTELLETIVRLPRNSAILLELFSLITDLLKMVSSPTFIDSPKNYLPGIVNACLDYLPFFESILLESASNVSQTAPADAKPQEANTPSEKKNAEKPTQDDNSQPAKNDDSLNSSQNAEPTSVDEKPSDSPDEVSAESVPTPSGSSDQAPEAPVVTSLTTANFSLLPTAAEKQALQIQDDSNLTPLQQKQKYSVRPVQPLKQIRLAVIKLIAALLNTNYRPVENELKKTQIIKLILNLFFSYPFNNILHGSATEVISALFHHEILFCDALEQSRTLPQEALSGEDITFVNTQSYPPLCEALFDEYKLPQNLIDIHEKNKKTVTDGRFRLGVLGHVTIIANHISDLVDISPRLASYLKFPAWGQFVEDILQKINNVENQFLGGEMPSPDLTPLSDDQSDDVDDEEDGEEDAGGGSWSF